MVRQVGDALPDRRIVDPFRPFRAEIFGVERIRLWGDPCRRMNAVRQVSDGDEVLR